MFSDTPIMYPATDPDIFWGYACAGHISADEFMKRLRKCKTEINNGIPRGAHKDSGPEHAWVHWCGFGGWRFCLEGARGARPITFWNSYENTTYKQWKNLTDGE